MQRDAKRERERERGTEEKGMYLFPTSLGGSCVNHLSNGIPKRAPNPMRSTDFNADTQKHYRNGDDDGRPFVRQCSTAFFNLSHSLSVHAPDGQAHRSQSLP
jgi:hypothetical protein